MQEAPISPERMTYPQILAQSGLVKCSARTNRRLAWPGWKIAPSMSGAASCSDDCPSSYPKLRWQLELPTPDHLRGNSYGFLRLAPCYVLIIPMAFIACRAAKLAVVAALQVWLVPSFGAKDSSHWPLAAPSFNSASRA